jgi:putative alpha-1,2-mannosidase
MISIIFIYICSVICKDPIDYIDPFIGTGNQGKTFPGVNTPTGMVKLSPDTVTGGDKYAYNLIGKNEFFSGSGYIHHHKTIQGFSMTHMSGV